MAEQEKLELARRAVACKYWRWMAGMRDLSSAFGPRRAVTLSAGDVHSAHELHSGAPEETSVRGCEAFGLPDLDDPATLGCLLALVREAWSCPGVYARESSRGGWVVCVRKLDPNGPVAAGPFRDFTESAALVAALEAAP